MGEIETGDTVTFDGLYAPIPNPHRRWWQPWKARQIDGPELKKFTVSHVVTEEGERLRIRDGDILMGDYPDPSAQ